MTLLWHTVVSYRSHYIDKTPYLSYVVRVNPRKESYTLVKKPITNPVIATLIVPLIRETAPHGDLMKLRVISVDGENSGDPVLAVAQVDVQHALNAMDLPNKLWVRNAINKAIVEDVNKGRNVDYYEYVIKTNEHGPHLLFSPVDLIAELLKTRTNRDPVKERKHREFDHFFEQAFVDNNAILQQRLTGEVTLLVQENEKLKKDNEEKTNTINDQAVVLRWYERRYGKPPKIVR